MFSHLSYYLITLKKRFIIKHESQHLLTTTHESFVANRIFLKLSFSCGVGHVISNSHIALSSSYKHKLKHLWYLTASLQPSASLMQFSVCFRVFSRLSNMSAIRPGIHWLHIFIFLSAWVEVGCSTKAWSSSPGFVFVCVTYNQNEMQYPSHG